MLNVFGSLLNCPIIKPMIEPFYDNILKMVEDELLRVKKIIKQSAVGNFIESSLGKTCS